VERKTKVKTGAQLMGANGEDETKKGLKTGQKRKQAPKGLCETR